MADEVNKEEVTPAVPPPFNKRYEQLISTLPLSEGWFPARLRNYRGCWYSEIQLPGAMAFLDHFLPQPTDIFLMSPPKSGTTWLKSLAFAAIHQKHHHPSSPNHPLLCLNPHDCVPLIDNIFGSDPLKLDTLLLPRILATHMPCSLLPDSVTSSRIIYICRDPKDTLVSTWHFVKEMAPENMESVPFAEAFEMYCMGVSPSGPLWDHCLGYWKESLRKPEKVLFLKYEEMMDDPVCNLKKLADFVGFPFSQEEEREGVVEGIVRLCSFEGLSSLEVNKKGHQGIKGVNVKNSSFFRKGKVGDWRNYMTVEMAQRLDEITKEKLYGSGLSFRSVEY